MGEFMENLESEVREFLGRHWDRKSPLLLGYSGGPDSRVLLDLLLRVGVKPELAHVDHGWREESREEAEALRLEADSLGLVFHMVRLEKDSREDVARQRRLEFFRSLYEKRGVQAVLLGHQENDWAETALKRVLEGAHLAYLGGMKPVSSWEKMVLWRPLLKISRKEILAYVESKGLKVVQDRTNLDPTYLRARMRLEMLPNLSVSFGKKIEGNLALLAERAFELKDYLDRRTNAAFSKLQKGPWGWILPYVPEEPIEARHLLQRLNISFTRSILDELVDALTKKLANRRVGKRFLADRGQFFYLAETFPRFEGAVAIREGVFFSGDWKIEISSSGFSPTHWKDLLEGEFRFFAPKEGYVLQMPFSKDGMALGKKQNERKIPAFLRPHLPHLYYRGQWASDLFTWEGSVGIGVRFSHLSRDSFSRV